MNYYTHKEFKINGFDVAVSFWIDGQSVYLEDIILHEDCNLLEMLRDLSLRDIGDFIYNRLADNVLTDPSVYVIDPHGSYRAYGHWLRLVV